MNTTQPLTGQGCTQAFWGSSIPSKINHPRQFSNSGIQNACACHAQEGKLFSVKCQLCEIAPTSCPPFSVCSFLNFFLRILSSIFYVLLTKRGLYNPGTYPYRPQQVAEFIGQQNDFYEILFRCKRWLE